MRRGINFETYDPARIEARREAQKPPALDRRTAPGPETRECDECGDPNAHFGEGVSILKGIAGTWLCHRHCAPEFRRKPT